jgi:hypothetical protein
MPHRFSDLVRLRTFAVACPWLLGITMPGCAVVEDIHADGATIKSIAFAAPLVLPSAPDGQANITKATGFGLVMSSGAATLGWFSESKIALDRDCRVVLVGNTTEQLRRFADLLGNTKALCSD